MSNVPRLTFKPEDLRGELGSFSIIIQHIRHSLNRKIDSKCWACLSAATHASKTAFQRTSSFIKPLRPYWFRLIDHFICKIVKNYTWRTKLWIKPLRGSAIHHTNAMKKKCLQEYTPERKLLKTMCKLSSKFSKKI